MNRHRVIFVDPELWTTPKENRMNPTITTGDWRRAGALLKHRLARDVDGCNAILEETIQVARLSNLIVALIGTLDAVADQLLTPLGLDGLNEWLEAWTRTDFDPTRPTEWTRAAALTVACHAKDTSEMHRVIEEGDDDNVTPVVLSIIDAYAAACPALATHTGSQVITHGLRMLTGMEAEGDQ
ncbi:hypothetical protein [Mycolicibacterium sp. D5.8-2]|uniref:hypothetical protein n=1 Tax=Mycolicibacterium sp. D5.8-2 TaxID=3085903 RepID=UPI00298C2D7E|nr:hypothetical protein [Mycolicibacterium sp. D5.8-2]MDW5613237.1 hypothetical protein [Mycolicibacterium sp. D5.8-2]